MKNSIEYGTQRGTSLPLYPYILSFSVEEKDFDF